MTISIITRWEDTQMPPELERRMWRQLKGAFAVREITFVDNEMEMDAALAALPKTTWRIFLEPTGKKTVSKIPRGDIVLILGNTRMHNLKHAQPYETYVIRSPNTTDLYGINAAAIALAVRYGQ